MENAKDQPKHHSSESEGTEGISRQSPAQEASPVTTQPTAETRKSTSGRRLPASEGYSAANHGLVHRGRRRSFGDTHAMATRDRPDQRQLNEMPNDRQITQSHGRRSRSGAPAVRLDMDLELDIDLKARIQGDITLSILYVFHSPTPLERDVYDRRLDVCERD